MRSVLPLRTSLWQETCRGPLQAEVTFGLNPPVFDAVRLPRESAAQALRKAIQEARDRRPAGSLEPILGWEGKRPFIHLHPGFYKV